MFQLFFLIIFQFLKLATCLFLTLLEVKSLTKWLDFLYDNIIADPYTTAKVAVPSLIYVIQNNLQFIAISNLDAATFQVTYQLKILTTALFSVVLLQKKLSKTQWFALLLLFVGVALVQLQPSQLAAQHSTTKQRPFIGFLAVLISSLCSGFAGVYFEKILKGKNKENSIWLRNIQLGSLSTVLAVCGMMVNDGEKLKKQGILYGYDNFVWLVVVMQAFGGLLVAVVVKYADNILKGFATSFAIILSCVISLYLFNFILSIQFIVGASLVMLAIYFYSTNPKL